MFEVARNRHWVVRRDLENDIVWVVRSHEPYASLEEIDTAFALVRGTLKGVPRARSGVIVDMREARWRNDDRFEAANRDHRAWLVEGFARAAILVQTAAGRLQVERIARAQGLSWLVFDDERLAHDYVAGRLPFVSASVAPKSLPHQGRLSRVA